MCNHKYEERTILNKNEIKICYFEILERQYHYFPDGLPIDSNGMCIFHSSDIQWKSKMNFGIYLKEFVKNANQDKSIDRIILDGAKIADANYKELEISIKKDFHLNNAKVFNPFVMSSNNDIAIHSNNTIYYKPVKIRNSIFRSIYLQQNTYKDSLSLDDLKIKGPLSMSNSIYEHVINVSDCSVNTYSIFNNNHFKSSGHLSWAIFKNINFGGPTNFKKCIFDCSFHMDNVHFESIVDFHGSKFQPVEEYYNIVHEPYSFRKLKLGEKAVLAFVGEGNKDEFFQDQVEFFFTDEIYGKIIFENLNFRFISKSSRDRIFKLEKEGKIEIGSGCIKYRHQTELKTIEIGEDGQDVIIEIARTFANYFISHNGVNLGIEIIEKNKNKLSFFYYTDEDISREAFDIMLSSTEEGIWSSLLLNSESSGAQLMTNNPKEAKKYFDGVISLMSIFQKIGFRISLNEWGQLETKHLVSALELGGQIPFSNGELHLLISKNSSTENLKGIIGGYKQLYLENSVSASRVPSEKKNKLVDTSALKKLLLEDKIGTCIDILSTVIKDYSPSLQTDIDYLQLRYLKILENSHISEYDLDRELSMIAFKIMQFLNIYDRKFNPVIEYKGLTVTAEQILKSKEMGMDSPNILYLDFKNIVYITSLSDYKNYVNIHTSDGNKNFKKTSLNELASLLPENFLRIEKSYIVNMDYCEGTFRNTVLYLGKTNKPIKNDFPVGGVYRDHVYTYLSKKYPN